MDQTQTEYIATDLDLTSSEDLRPLAEFFEAQGALFTMDVNHAEDGSSDAHFETKQAYSDPESCLSIFLTAIESLEGFHKEIWRGCTQRYLNMGYNCGHDPHCFTSVISNETLKRIGAVGASLVVTLYRAETPE